MDEIELPTAEEALAYAHGYEEGLRDAKEQDVASLIIERDTALANLAFEKALRSGAVRERDRLKGRVAVGADLLENLKLARRLMVLQMGMLGQEVEASPLIADIDASIARASA